MKKFADIPLAALAPAAMRAACAGAGPAVPPLPAHLQPPDGQIMTLAVQATGVQIYECRAAKDDPQRFEWQLKAPEAQLLDANGVSIGKHYAGPTWEANDGSRVVGEVKARDNGPDPGAIPWLLLTAKSNSGSGVFGRTLSILRLQTVGGLAPAAACAQAQIGQETRVGYKASYYFYAAAS
jgi:uncharacterized protein DUF3455